MDNSFHLNMQRTHKQPEGSGLCVAASVATLLQVKSLDLVLSIWDRRDMLPEIVDEPYCHWFTDKRHMPLWSAIIALAENGLGLGILLGFGEYGVPGPDPVWEENFFGSPQIGILTTPALVTVKSKKYEGGLHTVVWDNEARKVRDPGSKSHKDDLCAYIVMEWLPVYRLENFEGIT